jgi:membrane-bound inhibitor of C-type lysozyme
MPVIIILVMVAIAISPMISVFVPITAAMVAVGPPAIAVVVADANAMRLHNAAVLAGARKRHGLGDWRAKGDGAGGYGSEQEKRLRHRFVLSC